jgi:hypothetical protein
MMAPVLEGGIAVMSLFVGLFFCRFWRQTRDRLFLLFAWAFWIEGVNRAILAAVPHASESEPVFYLFRLLSYVLIILAIWQKNRLRK